MKKINWLLTPMVFGLLASNLATVSASKVKTPGVNSKHWQTAQMVKVVKSETAQEHAVQTKHQKLTLLPKVLKHATVKPGTTLSVRYLGHQIWQVAGSNYPSSKHGVWLVTNGSTKWFKSLQTKTVNAKWSTPHYAKLTRSIHATQTKVKVKNKQLVITHTTLKKRVIAKGTKGYVRSLGNGVWQFYNNQYPSNRTGVWLTSQSSTKFFKTITVPNQATTYSTFKSAYHTVSNSQANLQDGVYTTVYAPYGYQPIQFNGGFTLTPGSSVRVALDTANNRYLILNNGSTYGVPKSGNYQFVATNVSRVGSTGNNVESIYAPNDDHALVASDYQPQNGNLWIQVNANGQPVQYYFYTTQTKGQTGWAKAVAETKDGKQVIVPQTK